jgi:hypothetical protein
MLESSQLPYWILIVQDHEWMQIAPKHAQIPTHWRYAQHVTLEWCSCRQRHVGSLAAPHLGMTIFRASYDEKELR